MDLLALIALLVLVYVAWMVYQTFRSIELQLRDLQHKCAPVAPTVPAKEATISTFQGDVTTTSDEKNPISKRLVAGLEKAMLAASA